MSVRVKLKGIFSRRLAVGLVIFILLATSLLFFGFSKYLVSKIESLNKNNLVGTNRIKELEDLLDRKEVEGNYQLFSRSPGYFPNELEKGEKYLLECHKETDTSPIPQWTWRNDLNQTLLKGEKITEVCYNNELNSVVYWTSQPVERSQNNYQPFNEKLSLKIYNPNSKMAFTVIEERGGMHGSCGSILGWTKSENLYYECSSAADFSSGEEIIFVPIARRNVVRSCTVTGSPEPGVGNSEICSSYCQNDSECEKGYTCNKNENACVK